MSTLTSHRAALVDILTGAGLNAASYLQERPNPPLAIVTPGSPYIDAGNQFGSFAVHHTVVLLTRTATNEISTGALDDMIATALVAVASSAHFAVERVNQPGQFQVNNATYIGTTIDVSITSPISTEED